MLTACKNVKPNGFSICLLVSVQCSVLCGFGHIERDVVCMKKLGRAMAVVGEENCLKEETPDTRRECQEKPCRPQWYMSDWSEVRSLIFCYGISRYAQSLKKAFQNS